VARLLGRANENDELAAPHAALTLRMKQTPLHEKVNAELLALIPRDATRVVEVGCSSGALAREYRKTNPRCDYVGIEIDPEYAAVARAHCSSVLVANIEHIGDEQFNSLFPVSCWVFGDVLEHLYDPWSVLRRIRTRLAADASIVACIPNAQHWSVQLRLNTGDFYYEDAGLLDRTHIRWFTKTTITDMFRSSGFEIVEGGGRVVDDPAHATVLGAVRAFAESIQADAAAAVSNATPFQWVVRAMPRV
jgi:2-polyprenyl-3-methyl-5-hydroxy-6-metoxy-1,4-benzoquinol methylase